MQTENIQVHEATFEANDGLQLYERQWLPERETKAMVVLIHGGVEHSGRYAHVAHFLNQHGYAVSALDLRGHGRSEGRRLFVRSFDQYLDDVSLFLSRLGQQHTHLPLFLLGHSMGGTIATLFTLTRTHKIKGLILSGPFLKLGEDFSPLKVKVAKWVGKRLPYMPVEKLNAEYISRNKEVVRQYEVDPLVCHGWISARMAVEVMHAFQRIEEEEPQLNLPILLLHGTGDRLAEVEGTKRLYRRAGSDDKTLKLYEGYYHEVMNEGEKEQVMEDLLKWLEAHLDG